MLQLSLDGKRLHVTNSLYRSWDNHFYPGTAEHGSSLLQIDCDTNAGGCCCRITSTSILAG